MEKVLLFATVLAPVILALNEGVKISINLPKNLLPAIGLILGFIVGAASYPFTDMELALRLWAGGLSGLSAVGLFELGKYRSGNTKEEK